MFRTPGSREGRKRSTFTNIRLGTVAVSGSIAGFTGNTDAPAGNVLVGVQTACGSMTNLRYKPLQKLVGSTWTTITG